MTTLDDFLIEEGLLAPEGTQERERQDKKFKEKFMKSYRQFLKRKKEIEILEHKYLSKTS